MKVPGPPRRDEPKPGPGALTPEQRDHYRLAGFVVWLHLGVIVLAPVLFLLSGRVTSPAVWYILGIFVLFTAVAQGFLSLRPARVSWPLLGQLLMVVDLLLVTGLVWARGGLETDAYHFYYLVIVGSAILFGARESVAFAVAACLFYGVVVWLDAGSTEALVRVLIRTVYMVLTGFLAGYLSAQERRHRHAHIETKRLLSELQEAHIQLKAFAREMSQLAVTDGLTGLHNHTYFHQRLDEELSRADRYHRPLSLLMLDLDGFKRYNDTYGHPKGDLILAEVARLITAAVRKVDVPCRYGGEEFAVILPETDSQAAVAAAERIRLAVEGALVEGPGPSHLTVSAGVASFPIHARSRTELIEAADRALYLSKSRGKNAVTLYGPAVASGGHG